MQVSIGKKIYDKYGVYIILAALFIFFSITSEGFFSLGNVTNLLRTAAVYILFGCGMTFVMISGKIDLSIGAIAALSGCVVSLCVQAGMTTVPASVIGIAVGVGCGLLNGFCIAKLRVPFFIMTAGMMYGAAGVALVITHETSVAIVDSERARVPFEFWGSQKIGLIPSQFIVAMIFFVICLYIMKNTKMGRYTYAIGSNEKTARLSGVNVDKYNILIFTLNGLAAAIAGMVLASRLMTGSPNVADGGYNKDRGRSFCNLYHQYRTEYYGCQLFHAEDCHRRGSCNCSCCRYDRKTESRIKKLSKDR